MSAIEEMIRKRAYELWEQAGCPDGRSYEFWFAARTEIEAARSPDPQEPRAKAARAGDRVVAAAAKPAVEKSPKAPASVKPKPRKSIDLPRPRLFIPEPLPKSAAPRRRA